MGRPSTRNLTPASKTRMQETRRASRSFLDFDFSRLFHKKRDR